MNLAQVFSSGTVTSSASVAIHHRSHHLPYSQVHHDVERIAGHLLSHGVRPGQFVGTDSPNPVTHWLTLLALMRLGAITVSVSKRYEDETAVLPELSMVLSDVKETRTYGPGIRQVRIKRTWVTDAPPGAEALPSPEQAAAALGRISFTSGTTGRPKAVLLDSRLLHARVAGTAERSRIGARSVLWCGLGPDSSFGFITTLAAWLAGGSIIFSHGGKGAYRYLYENHVNQIVASPAALNALARDAMSGSLPRLQASVMVGGGRLTTGMRDRLLGRICPEVLVSFGCSEAGGIAAGDSAGLDANGGYVGRIAPDVEVRILSDIGEAEPPGQTGHLWVTSPSITPSYVRDPAADREHFRDGWFRTGDLAQVSGDRDLVILGRSVDIFNLGGLKVAAADIDSIVNEFCSPEDVCAVPLKVDDPDAQLAIVIVGTLPDPDALGARILSTLPTMPPFLLVSARAIERSAMGKVNRTALGNRISDAAGRDGGSASDFGILGKY
jgi:acyl-CoA synthetase (AMP-forming)/AMP-acid ligase II